MVRHLPFLFRAPSPVPSMSAGSKDMSERLETSRLFLRPPADDDVAAIVALLGDFDVSKNLSSPPHPYREEDAIAFVERVRHDQTEGVGHCFMIFRHDDDALIGSIGFRERSEAIELGYWIGKPYWGQGYASEAARRTIDFAFGELNLGGLVAGWFHDNPASGRVLEKLGFVRDGEDERHSSARGHAVQSLRMALSRATWERARA
jgi:[ribosomal protein S5]-alanine N-acetyltransferase